MMTVETLDRRAVQDFLHDLIQVDQPPVEIPCLDAVLEDFHRLGVDPGRPVMVALPNGRQFVTAVFALLIKGAVPVLLPSSAPPLRIARMAQVIGADALIASNISSSLQNGDAPDATSHLARFTFLADMKTRHYQPGEIILLTSGTSGIFSGCLFRVNSLLLNAARHARAIALTAADRVLISLPMYYSFAFVAQLLATFALGATAIIAGPPFSPAYYERAIHDHEATASSLTPIMVDSWRRAGHEKLPPTLRRLTVGGAALDTSSVADVLVRNPRLELYLTYGLTEAGPRVSTLAAHLEPPRRYASVGLPLPGLQVHLRKEHSGDEFGELVVETDTGLLRPIGRGNVPATSLDGHTKLISTGDLFEMDDDNYLFFRGRRPNSVIIRGEKVCLRSVCEVAESIAGVSSAEAWTHRTATGDLAFTLDVYRKDTSVTEAEVRRQLAKTLLRSEQPAHLVFHPDSQVVWRKTRV